MSARAFGTVLVMLAVAACAEPEAPDADGAWVGTITTEGDVTTVINESGSVWGGTARLVEEASIGVDAGANEYMFGTTSAIEAHEGRIYVLDTQVPVVRGYDWSGTWIADIGRGGQGPGELGEGFSAAVGLAIGPEGRIYVHNRSRIEVFSREGEYLDTWQIGRGSVLGTALAFAVPSAGSVLFAAYLRIEERVPWRRGIGVQMMTQGEPVGDLAPLPNLGYNTPRVEQSVRGGGMWAMIPPFVPTLVWNISPSGDVLIGRADRYEVERHRSDGSKAVISRAIDAVAVAGAELAWHERRMRLNMAVNDAVQTRGYDMDAGLPRHKPAFEQFIPTHDGGVWVVRAGPGEEHPGCAEAGADLGEMAESPCWTDTYVIDAFAADGRYLGEVVVPEVFYNKRYQKFRPTPYVRADQFIAAIEDEAGTIMVKRYRLVLPGER